MVLYNRKFELLENNLRYTLKESSKLKTCLKYVKTIDEKIHQMYNVFETDLKDE